MSASKWPLLVGFGLALALPGATAQKGTPRLHRASVAGVQVGGLSPYEARVRVARALDRRLDERLVITDGVKKIARTRRQLGIHLDVARMIALVKAGQAYVPLHFLVDRRAFQKALQRLAPQFTFPGRKARVVEWRGRVRVLPEQNARRVNVSASARRLADQIEKHPTTRVLRLTLIKTPPRLTAARLRGINGRLSRFTTRFDPGNIKRLKNIRLAARSIDGKVLPPGTVFSLNRTVGPRTQDRGYRTAPVLVDGKLVPGIGGGVSQVTGTLFNAALLAGLPILEYDTHARPVSYLPVGRDATVAWRHIDLKFRNNTRAPIYISYRLSGNQAIATLYGARKLGQRVKLSVKSKKLGPRKMTAALYRVTLRNGKPVKKERIGRSNYKWKPQK
jgi:vancomycin resistance protein YoaR